MEVSAAGITPPGPALVGIDVEPEYVLGFPVYVGMTIGSAPPSASLMRLPLPSPAALRGAVGLRLWRPGEAEPFFEEAPTAVVDPELSAPSFRLRAGEIRRLLVEISELLPDDLSAGAVDGQLLYGAPPHIAESARGRLLFREPMDAERASLDELRTEVEAAGSFGRWLRRPPSDPSRLAPPTDRGDPLRYPRLIKYLIHGPEGLDTVDPALLNVLGGVFAPEAYGLAAELLAARDPGAFAGYAQQVKAAYPALAAWMDAIAAGQSEIAWARSHR
ncbi:hypothetical protein [Sorangium cellulosum]|uniref:hypothetical protein n=1 Tax=Sorangium cellulosum TaxID=56 RepID=UPI0007C79BD1|nr:hypothetical protein [Sorangium cellulosum]